MCTYSQNNLAATWKNKQNAHAPKMVQDCVFAQSSEFQFGFKRKNVYNPGLAGSEFGQFLSPNPGRFSSGYELGRTLLTKVPRKASSFLRTPNPGRFGFQRKNRARPWFGRFGERPVPFSERKVGANLGTAGSEKDRFLSPNFKEKNKKY